MKTLTKEEINEIVTNVYNQKLPTIKNEFVKNVEIMKNDAGDITDDNKLLAAITTSTKFSVEIILEVINKIC